MAYQKKTRGEKETKYEGKIATHEGKYGEHPVGGAVGAAIGAAAGAGAVGAAQGAAMGTAAGFPGMLAGAGVGGVVGALAGKAAAQEINPTTEDAYWSENYRARPYVEKDADYDSYGPAYRYGIEACRTYEGRTFDEIEPQLRQGWDRVRGKSLLSWEKAKFAVRDAYDRLRDRVQNRP